MRMLESEFLRKSRVKQALNAFTFLDNSVWIHGIGKMGKKKVISEEEISTLVLPATTDVLGIAVRLMGFDRVLVRCQDGKERLCRIRGKMKRRVWIREGDVVLVSPWDFQFDKRGDIVWRYRRNQVELLRSKGYLTIETR